ncbi:MAG: hypothetical protein ACK45H_03265, partial [Bacteroidota bacterium]
MALIHSFEKSGNTLFRYRGQLPVLLFLMSVPVVYFTDYRFLDNNVQLSTVLMSVCGIISFFGQYVRAVAIGTSNK